MTFNQIAAAALFAGAMVFIAAPAQADTSYKACVVGDRVANKALEVGTVTETRDGISCYVDMDNGEKHSYYLMWMLHLANTPLVNPALVKVVKVGRYTCYAGVPVQYTFSDIIITSGSTYKDNRKVAGRYRYSAATQIITFVSGSFKGAYAKYRDDGSIGLASKPGGFFATSCGLVK